MKQVVITEDRYKARTGEDRKGQKEQGRHGGKTKNGHSQWNLPIKHCGLLNYERQNL